MASEAGQPSAAVELAGLESSPLDWLLAVMPSAVVALPAAAVAGGPVGQPAAVEPAVELVVAVEHSVGCVGAAVAAAEPQLVAPAVFVLVPVAFEHAALVRFEPAVAGGVEGEQHQEHPALLGSLE